MLTRSTATIATSRGMFAAIRPANMTAANAAVWATESEKKLPVMVTKVMPSATVPMVAAARTMFSWFSMPRKPGVADAPNANSPTSPVAASTGTSRCRFERSIESRVAACRCGRFRRWFRRHHRPVWGA